MSFPVPDSADPVQRVIDPRSVVLRKVTYLGDGLAEVIGGDGLVGDGPVPGREPRDRAAAEVHDDLDEVPQLLVPRQPAPHPRGHNLQERLQLAPRPGRRRANIRRRQLVGGGGAP